MLNKSLGFQFDYKSYGCHSIYEFINKFIIPNTEVVIITSPKNDTFIVRSS